MRLGVVYAAGGMGLGDCWASINTLLRWSELTKTVFRISDFYLNRHREVRHPGAKLREIIPLLNSSGTVEVVSDTPTRYLKWKLIYRMDFYPTYVTWSPNTNPRVVYQFDGKSHPEKNFTPQEESQLLEFLVKHNYAPVPLGWQTTLRESIDIASQSQFFIGVDSGFAHIMHSMGTPVLLTRNARTEAAVGQSHFNKEFVLSKDLAELFTHIECMKEHGVSWYRENLHKPPVA